MLDPASTSAASAGEPNAKEAVAGDAGVEEKELKAGLEDVGEDKVVAGEGELVTAKEEASIAG